MQNKIGLDFKKSTKLADMLNDLLANYQVFYQNMRGFHWNIKGQEFFQLHEKFEEYYNDAIVKIDEIAERILTLGQTPLHTYEDYLKLSKIKSHKEDAVDHTIVKTVVDNFSVLISKEREILAVAADATDEGTVSQMSDYITETEKVVWMLHAYLGK